MNYYLACDAGGTKTEWLLADERRVLARTRTGSIKRMRVGAEDAARNLNEALTAVSAESGISLQSITATCIGAASASIPMVADFLRKAISQRVSGELLIVGDEDIALDAAFHGGRGVVVICGTGSNVAGRAADGQMARAGGWGPAISDEGSGYWIGQQAVRSAFRALDSRQPTGLIESIQSHWGLSSMEDVVARANIAPDFAALAPVVVACAEAGDAVALEVLRRGGEELAALCAYVIDRMKQLETGSDSGTKQPLPEVAFTGSILQQVALLRDAMSNSLSRAYPQIKVHRSAVDSMDGALWLARRLVS